MPWNRLTQPLSRAARQGLPRPFRSSTRFVPLTVRRFNSSDPKNTGQYNPDPTDQNDSEEDRGQGRKNDDPTLKSTILKMLETAATTAASIAILGYVCNLPCMMVVPKLTLPPSPPELRVTRTISTTST